MAETNCSMLVQEEFQSQIKSPSTSAENNQKWGGGEEEIRTTSWKSPNQKQHNQCGVESNLITYLAYSPPNSRFLNLKQKESFGFAADFFWEGTAKYITGSLTQDSREKPLQISPCSEKGKPMASFAPFPGAWFCV